MKRIITALVLILILSACEKATISHKFIMKPEGWQKFDNLAFTDSSFTNEKPYKVILNLTIDNTYPENDFVFQMIYETAEGETWNRAFTVNIKDKEGHFIQKENNGKMIYNKVLVPEKYFNTGKYNFEVVNLNPKIVSPGVVSIEFVFKQ